MTKWFYIYYKVSERACRDNIKSKLYRNINAFSDLKIRKTNDQMKAGKPLWKLISTILLAD